MKKLTSFFTYILCLIVGYSTLSASDNLTDASYMIDLGKLDPLKGDTNRSTPPGGIASFQLLLESITNILLVAIPIIAVIAFIVAGFLYVLSAGDSEKASRAKTIIKWNIVAMAVGYLSLAIIRIIASFFS
jgi:Type IV secretion system pilin